MKTYAKIDIVEAAKEMIEKYDGDFKNVDDNNWMRLFAAESIRTATKATELDRCEYSIKYNANLNFGIVWDLKNGIRVETESLRKLIFDHGQNQD